MAIFPPAFNRLRGFCRGISSSSRSRSVERSLRSIELYPTIAGGVFGQNRNAAFSFFFILTFAVAISKLERVLRHRRPLSVSTPNSFSPFVLLGLRQSGRLQYFEEVPSGEERRPPADSSPESVD